MSILYLNNEYKNMEEFIEKFNAFRDWLYDEEKHSEAYSEYEKNLKKIITKFEELGLNNVF